ncbi:MAG TPA: hypothetical protein VF528_11220 [Pyrinomonadaceae bacterium]|jgi:hypothetical protein
MRFLTASFAFYREWYWWVLFLIVTVAAYVQWVAYHLEKDTELLRFQFGYLYFLPGVVSLAALILILFLCGWVSVVINVSVMFLLFLLLRSTIHYHGMALIGLFPTGGSD